MNLPTFLIAGAPRAGTTFLYHALDRHPETFLAKPVVPEPKYFLVDDEYEKGLAYYSQKYFAGVDGHSAIGEKSTNYLENPAVPARIRRELPGMKFVFAIRNPIERAFSNYLWSKKNGLEILSFEEALDAEAEREAAYLPAHRYSRPFSYLSRGLYAALLEPYFELFGAGQLQFVFLEEIEAAPRATIDELCRFLGVHPFPESVELPTRLNSARSDFQAISVEVRERLREVYRNPNRRLGQLLGRDLSHWT